MQNRRLLVTFSSYCGISSTGNGTEICPNVSKSVFKGTDQRLIGFNLYLPDKVHAQQSLFNVNSLSGPDSLIAYTDSLVVGSHFSPPHPGRLTENHRMGVLQLWDLDVCALQTEISE